MSYFVTGATGFIGRHLVEELLDHREGDVFVLVREGSRARLDALLRQWGDRRVVPVVGDLADDALGVDPAWVEEHAGEIDHVFHLAAIYDMTADDATNDAMNVDGTRHALALAEALDAGCFHQVSSVAAAGDFRGVFDETMFAEGQHLPSAYHRTKYESERIVREEATVPWRVYRPAIVVGHSQTGAMDKVDGPYYFFPLLKMLRDALPAWLPLVGVDLGDTNVVPVDYVASAMDHLAHLARPRRRGVPPRQPRAAAGGRRHQPLLRRGRGAPRSRPRSTAASPPRDRSAWCPARSCAPPRPGGRGPLDPGAGAARPDPRAGRRPGRGASATPASPRSSTPGVRRRHSPAPASRCPTSSPTPARCGATGRTTSTRPPAATARSAPPCRASTSSSPAPRRASARSPRSRSPRPAASRCSSPAARTSSRRPGR